MFMTILLWTARSGIAQTPDAQPLSADEVKALMSNATVRTSLPSGGTRSWIDHADGTFMMEFGGGLGGKHGSHHHRVGNWYVDVSGRYCMDVQPTEGEAKDDLECYFLTPQESGYVASHALAPAATHPQFWNVSR
jgi:hypothetical protein